MNAAVSLLLSGHWHKRIVGHGETRSLGGQVEVRAGRLAGLAVPYGQASDVGGFLEEFVPGAFTNLASPDILHLAGHDQTRLLGRTGAGTLRFDDRSDGLYFSADLPDTSDGNDADVLAGRGDYGGASVGFRVLPGGEQWSRTADGRRLRTITRAELDHLSPVGRPAYNTTTLTREE